MTQQQQQEEKARETGDAPEEMAKPIPGVPRLELSSIFDPNVGFILGFSDRGVQGADMVTQIRYQNLGAAFEDLNKIQRHLIQSMTQFAEATGFQNGVAAVRQQLEQQQAAAQEQVRVARGSDEEPTNTRDEEEGASPIVPGELPALVTQHQVPVEPTPSKE